MSATALPLMAVPVLRTPDLAAAIGHYCGVFGFEPLQRIPGVLGILRLGPVTLQLWQCPPPVAPACARIQLDEPTGALFDLHKRLGRRLKDGLATPRLQPWGAWEFQLVDGEGNTLVFVQWATTGAFTQAGQGASRLDRQQPAP